MNRAINLLGALSIGAGLMYVLDPDRGEKRRKRAQKQLKSTLKQARHGVNEISSNVGERAGKLANRGWDATEPVRERLSDYSDAARKNARKLARNATIKNAGEYAGEWIDSGRDLGNRAIERAGDLAEPYAEQAQGMAGKLGKQMQRYVADLVGVRQGPSPWIFALTGLGIGAGLMFLLDPSTGGSRRALVGERVSDVINSDKARTASEDIQNWARQLLIQVKTLLGNRAEEEIDERLRKNDSGYDYSDQVTP